MLREIAGYGRRDNERIAISLVFCLRLLVILPAVLVPASAAYAEDLPALSALQDKGARVSGLVVDLGDGEVIAGIEPDRLAIPASVTKLVTAARALEAWGPEHSFSTRLAATAPVRNGVVEGDLVFIGGGDPALTEQGLWRLARDLAQAGVREVRGDLVVDASRFGHVDCATRDRCEALQQSRNAYAAPLSSAGVNFAAVALKLHGQTSEGEKGAAIPDPFDLPFIEVTGDPVTGQGSAGDLKVIRRTAGDRDQLIVQGALPVADTPFTVWRSVTQPERHSGELLKAFLEREGIQLGGATRVAYSPTTYAVILAEYNGRPLADTLRGMLYYSTNYSADVLALELAREAGHAAPIKLGDGGLLLGRYLDEVSAESRFGASDRPEPRLFDGSGLNPDNRLTARQVVGLLDHVYLRMNLFPTFLGGLTVPLHGPDDRLRGQDPAWSAQVAGKTGGLSEPVSVAAFAGYLRFRDGGWGAFAFLVNGSPGKPVSRAEAFAAMRKDVLELRQ